MTQPASAYFLSDAKPRPAKATLSITVDNEVGALARVVGLFSGRGYNIESLTVAETDHQKHTSRITIVTSGTVEVVPVHRVVDLAVDKPGLEREMALVKIAATGDNRAEALRLAEVFRARVIDISPQSFVFELTGTPVKIDAFVEMMIPIGLVELSRTGVVAIGRGADAT